MQVESLQQILVRPQENQSLSPATELWLILAASHTNPDTVAVT